MPTFKFEAMDPTGQEIKDEIEAQNEEEAQATIRQMGYYVTKIAVKRSKAVAGPAKAKKKRAFAIGGVSTKELTLFTRQLSILQDAGLPILRSLRILQNQAKGARMRNSLMDVCDEIESGSTLSEAMSKSPKAFDRLYVNMIKAGEAGGAMELILKRLADFKERAQALKRKVQGALVYPAVVITVAVGILTFIMIKIVPAFQKIFEEMEIELPMMTQLLINFSAFSVNYWWTFPLFPTAIWLFLKLLCKFSYGRMGFDLFCLKVPIFGPLVEKNNLARTTRTLGTLVASGVPILEALNITRETAGNAVFERMFQKVSDAIREGESIARPLKEASVPPLNFITAMLFFAIAPVIGLLLYLQKYKQRVVDDLVVSMVDVGEETGELDTMLYKVADTFDEEVKVITESLMSLMEPLIIVVLGGSVGFIVIALFVPLIKIITALT